MDPTQESLKKETEKWLSRLEKDRSHMNAAPGPLEKSAKSALRNLDAYIKDTRHFMEKQDFVRAFEAVIYAWGILETCERLGLLEKK